jgi:hypothetical protein
LIQDNTSKIEVIFTKNNAYISQLAEIYRTINSEITLNANTPESTDIKMIRLLESNAKTIDKIIKDNLITINDLLAKNVLDYSYYENQSNNFLKRALHVSNTIPSVITLGTLTADVIFKNLGMFFSWTDIKSITLEVTLMDNDNNQISTDDFPLDVNITGNEPGDENNNEDYLKEKLFEISVSIPALPPGEYYFILTIKDPGFVYYDSFKVNVTMM